MRTKQSFFFFFFAAWGKSSIRVAIIIIIIITGKKQIKVTVSIQIDSFSECFVSLGHYTACPPAALLQRNVSLERRRERESEKKKGWLLVFCPVKWKKKTITGNDTQKKERASLPVSAQQHWHNGAGWRQRFKWVFLGLNESRSVIASPAAADTLRTPRQSLVIA